MGQRGPHASAVEMDAAPIVYASYRAPSAVPTSLSLV